MVIIFVFAHPTIRKKAYRFFWLTHSCYVILYALMLIHGLARITGPPRFWFYFICPGIVFLLDKVKTYSDEQLQFFKISVIKLLLLKQSSKLKLF